MVSVTDLTSVIQIVILKKSQKCRYSSGYGDSGNETTNLKRLVLPFVQIKLRMKNREKLNLTRITLSFNSFETIRRSYALLILI